MTEEELAEEYLVNTLQEVTVPDYSGKDKPPPPDLGGGTTKPSNPNKGFEEIVVRDIFNPPRFIVVEPVDEDNPDTVNIFSVNENPLKL